MELEYTSKFKKHYKKLTNPISLKNLEDILAYWVNSYTPNLNGAYSDHRLKGKLRNFRELHLDGNDLLMYKVSNNIITLEKIVTHKELDKLNKSKGSLYSSEFINIFKQLNLTSYYIVT